MRKRIIRILCCLACLLTGAQTIFAAKPWKLAVLSDVHLMSPQLIFTGHLHSQDIAQRGGLVDVETGSTVSYPHPYRIITVGNGSLDIHTHHLTQIASLARQGINMTEKSKHFAILSVEKMVNNYLPAATPEPARKAIGEMLGEAYIIDLYGDEHPDSTFLQKKQRVIDAVSLLAPDKAKLVDAIATSLTTDFPPKDNDVKVKK